MGHLADWECSEAVEAWLTLYHADEGIDTVGREGEGGFITWARRITKGAPGFTTSMLRRVRWEAIAASFAIAARHQGQQAVSSR